MSDYYTEQLVKQKAKASSMIAKTALIAVTVLSFFLCPLLFPMAMIIPVIMVVVDIVLFKRFDLEFEYLYVNGDLDIDKYYGKTKKKKSV